MFSSMMFSSLMVPVVLPMLLMQYAVAQVDVSVSPAQMDVGLSPSLDVNCTYSSDISSPMAELISLTVSSGGDTQLASITSFSDQATVFPSEGLTADGVINQEGQSYIHLHWDSPTDAQGGTYQCVARGLDVSGQNVEAVNTSVVSVNQPDIQKLIKELDRLEKIQSTLFGEIQEMSANITQLESNISSLNAQMKNQIDVSSVFLLPPLRYKNKRYFVSKAPFQDFNESIIICKAYGGILAEIDDLDEYHNVQNFLGNLTGTGVYVVYIGGTDQGHNGAWILPSSNEVLPVVDWAGPGNSTDDRHKCLTLNWTYSWSMYSYHCHFGTTDNIYRYLCEV